VIVLIALTINIQAFYLPFEVSTFAPISHAVLLNKPAKINTKDAEWILKFTSSKTAKKPARDFYMGLARFELRFNKRSLILDQTGAFKTNDGAGVLDKKQLNDLVEFLRKHLKKPDGSPVSERSGSKQE
jgi:hypothetical protein